MTSLHSKKRMPLMPKPKTRILPYRAEHPRQKIVGEWRENVEEAMQDGRALGHGARVMMTVGTNGTSSLVLLARFDNIFKPENTHSFSLSPAKALKEAGKREESEESEGQDD